MSAAADMNQPEDLPLSKQIAYAVGQLGWSTLMNILTIAVFYFYIPPENAKIPFYVTQFTFFVVLNAVNLLLVGGRLFDAVSDPLIASFSDRSKNPKGRRIPFLAWGTIPSALFCTLMFLPPVDGVSTLNLIWLGVMQILFFFSLTVYVTPYFALLPELGHTSRQRLNLSTYISITWALGLVLATTPPAIGGMLEASFGLSTVQGMQGGVAIVSLIAAICMFVPVIFIEEKRYCASVPSTEPLWPALRQALNNRHFRFYVVADMAYFCSIAIINTGILYYVTVLLFPDDPSKKDLVTPMGAVMVATSFLLYVPANLLARKFGKKLIINLAFLLFGISFTYIFFLGKLPLSPTIQAYLLGVLAAIPLASLGVLPNAVLADIAEHDAHLTGKRMEGMFFAARTFLQKFGTTAGIFVFAALTTFGKDPGDDLGIRLSGPVGFALCLLAAAFFMRYEEKKVLAELKEIGKS